jgi:general secretion pathway protein K
MRHRDRVQVKQRGFVLVAVLLIIVVLATLVVEFYYDARLALHLSDNVKQGSQALHCARAGLIVATELLGQRDCLWEEPSVWEVVSGKRPLSVGAGQCHLQVREESGKINVNMLKTPDGQLDRVRVEQVLRVIDIVNGLARDTGATPVSYDIVPAMIDWIDRDEEVTVLPFVKGTNRGAESRYYRQLKQARPCKNATFETLNELLLVKGITPDILYGNSPEESGNVMSGLNHFLTVYGDRSINVNYASPEVIQCLSEHISAALARAVAEHKPYTRAEELKKVPGMTAPAYRALQATLGSAATETYFRVTATGTMAQMSRCVHAVLKKDKTGAVTPILCWES